MPPLSVNKTVLGAATLNAPEALAAGGHEILRADNGELTGACVMSILFSLSL